MQIAYPFSGRSTIDRCVRCCYALLYSPRNTTVSVDQTPRCIFLSPTNHHLGKDSIEHLPAPPSLTLGKTLLTLDTPLLLRTLVISLLCIVMRQKSHQYKVSLTRVESDHSQKTTNTHNTTQHRVQLLFFLTCLLFLAHGYTNAGDPSQIHSET